MLQTFSLNLLFNNAKSYLSPSSGSPLGSGSNSYESLKDTSDTIFSTPSSSPRTPGPETLSTQTISPSLAPPVTTATVIRPSLCTLPFPPSQTSLAPNPDPATPSLLDTSISFARMMDRTGSPASFLTCSSGWDPSIICSAVAFPSLLDSRPSIDNLPLAQEIHWVTDDSKTRAERSPWEAKSSQVLSAVATLSYFPPSLKNADSTCLRSLDFVASTPPRTALEPQHQLHSLSSKHSPQSASPGSEFSFEESTTSSVCDDPFYWDAILAGLPPSPQRSPAFAISVCEPLSVGLPTTSPVPSAIQRHIIDTHSPERYSIGPCTSPAIIPTIVVLDPDSVMVPAQASVSSIIGLYGSRRDSTQTITGELPTPEPQASEDEPDQALDEDDTDGEDSSPESEFEIIAVPALRVRLDTISETDEVDVEGAFGSLMTLGSIASRNSILVAGEQPSTEFLANAGRAFSSFSSASEPSIDATSVLSSGQTFQSDPKVSASTSFASTAKLFYAQSGTSISGESAASSCRPTASGSESDCPWLFYVEEGKILEVPRSPTIHGAGKLADKLARFPNVPKSPQLTPLPSPFTSPPPSPSAVNPYFTGGSFLTLDISRKRPSATTTMDVAHTGSLLSPYFKQNAAGYSTTFSSGIRTSHQPTASAESSSITEITFRELDVDLGLSHNFGPLVSDTLPTDSSSSSGYSIKLSTAQSATPSYGRHVRFESADFRTSSVAAGQKHFPHPRRPCLNRSKVFTKKRRRVEKNKSRRSSSDASTGLVRSPGVDCDHLSSSFSSGSIPKRGSWWRHGGIFVAIGRMRRGIQGCLSVQEEETFGGTVWATEREYWNDHLSKGESKRPSDLMRNDDGRALLRRIRRYTQ